MNHKTVQRLMKELGLVCRVRIKKYHSYKGEVGKIAPNLLNRNFYAEKPNQKWVTDVTEFSLFGQKMYLSPILDLHNGYLVSYTISDRPVLGMITSMLEKAFETIPDGTGLILHSDQGWQYQHKKYQHMIRRKGIRQSMSRKGNCLDNAVMENFFGLLKSVIAGLEDISDGVFKIDGKVMNDVEPKDRDIAMVFQNYALYPHMTVYDNMAFGLKLRKVPKAEIDKKVREAARILDLDKLLDRKPKALSGGQRQRVAMGRAIVRNPKVFLMDEPLSNLDAKLRVQMRIEISKLHENLGATIIYVTHDQTEAMTLGTRIVVMKDGVVQQVDTPQNLYNTPCNLFVAGFIGSPQMNFMDAVCSVKGDDVTLTVGKHVLKVPASKKQALINGNYDGKTVVLGIRPEDVHDSQAFISNSPDSIIESEIKVYELLGAEVFLYFDVEGTQMTARVNPRTTLRTGDKAVFALDMEKIHVFDKETELTITN